MTTEVTGLWERRVLYLLSWPTFDTIVQSIVDRVLAEDADFDCVLGVSRGGLVPAVALSNALDIPRFAVVAVRRNVGSGQYLDKAEPELVWHGEPDAVRGRRVLVVDDVAGSGATLDLVRAEVLRAGAAVVRTAVVVRMRRGEAVADLVGVELDDWVVFPWEPARLPPDVTVADVVAPPAEGAADHAP